MKTVTNTSNLHELYFSRLIDYLTLLTFNHTDLYQFNQHTLHALSSSPPPGTLEYICPAGRKMWTPRELCCTFGTLHLYGKWDFGGRKFTSDFLGFLIFGRFSVTLMFVIHRVYQQFRVYVCVKFDPVISTFVF